MLKSAWMSVAAIALLSAAAILLPNASPRVIAQSAPTYVNAVDLDIVPEHREKFLAAIKENGAATVKEPGCRQFDILVLASNPNHVFLYEVYDNEAALQSHRNTEHFKKYAATTANMVAKREVRAMSPVALNAKGH
jgi:(4S)-4-hydroxy-5-phosphonooxypentane-2,3-dione isomerase